MAAGWPGPEAALTAARLGCEVDLYEMRAVVDGKPRLTPAHQTTDFGELVCSNSLKSESPNTAPWLLKQEMRRAGSALLRIADETAVPAGHALAVDRVEFSRRIGEAIAAEPSHSRDSRRSDEPGAGPDAEVALTIVATGPLTSDALSAEIERITGAGHLAFYDSISPIVDAESIDMSRVYFAARWDKGTADYINCPMDRAEYDRFYDALLAAEAAESKEWEKRSEVFSRAACRSKCWPRRGRDTLRFGPMKPVGLRDPRTGKNPWAVVQLRKENLRADSYNLVGFQNHLKFGEQARVLRLIPGLENARFLRYGQIHRNTYICAPALLDETLRLSPKRAHLRVRTCGCGKDAKQPPQPSCSPVRSAASRATPNPSPRACWRASMQRRSCAARSPRLFPAQRLSARWSTTSRTPMRRTFSPPTSPSTCWSRSKRMCARRSATRRSGTGSSASGRWRRSMRGGRQRFLAPTGETPSALRRV